MKIYIGNLSRLTTEDALRAAFEKFGEVLSVKLIKDRETQEPRGFAFVEMNDAEKAQDAINSLNGTELDGNNIRVNEALPQGERPFRSPRSGGSRGGFGSGNRSGGSRGGFGSGNRDGRSSGGFGGGRDRSSKFNNNGGGWR